MKSKRKISNARIQQITNDIAEGMGNHTKAELRQCVTHWAVEHEKACCRKANLKTSMLSHIVQMTTTLTQKD